MITSTAFVIGVVLVIALGLAGKAHARKAALTGRLRDWGYRALLGSRLMVNGSRRRFGLDCTGHPAPINLVTYPSPLTLQSAPGAEAWAIYRLSAHAIYLGQVIKAAIKQRRDTFRQSPDPDSFGALPAKVPREESDPQVEQCSHRMGGSYVNRTDRLTDKCEEVEQ